MFCILASAAAVPNHQRPTKSSTAAAAKKPEVKAGRRGRKASDTVAHPTPQESQHITKRGEETQEPYAFGLGNNQFTFFKPLSPSSAASFLFSAVETTASPVLARRYGHANENKEIIMPWLKTLKINI